MVTKPIKIGLLWHSLNSPNLGIGALTVSNLNILSGIAKKLNLTCEFHLIHWDDVGDFNENLELDITVSKLKAKDFLPLNSGLIKTLKKSDLVFDIGAGDSWTDLYGKKRFLYLFLSKLFAITLRKPVILSPQTIGPFHSRICKIMAKTLMSKCAYVFARDEQSFSYLQNLGNSNNIGLATDVAFNLPYSKSKKINDGKLHIGLNVSALLYSKERSGSDLISLRVNYKELVDRIIRFLLADKAIKLYLVPHVISRDYDYENDMKISKTIQQQFPDVIVIEEFKSPIAIKSLISGFDLLIGSRMHATIAAISSHVPVLPLSYSRKFNGLYESLNYPYLADLTADTEEQVFNKVVDIINNLDHAKLSAEKSLEQAKQKLSIYENYLESVLSEFSQ